MKLVFDLSAEEKYMLEKPRRGYKDVESVEIVRAFVKSGINQARVNFEDLDKLSVNGKRLKLQSAIKRLGFKDVIATARGDEVYLIRKK